MDAMEYEFLIRAVFKCGRTYKYGADANIFRGLEYAATPYPGQKAVDQFKLGEKTGEVAAHLCTALYEIRDQYEENGEFAEKIDKCTQLLIRPTLDKIDKCIKQAWEAFREAGIQGD